MPQLKWEYEDGEQIAWHNGYRIRAVRDEDAANPFEDWDGNWPLAVRYDGRIRDYDKTKDGYHIRHVLARFGDEALVHDQIAIAKILGTTIRDISIDYGWPDCDATPVNYITDGDVLRCAFEEALDNLSDSERFDALAELYDLCGIPALSATSRGYSQGDYAEVLVVATPEACKEFGCDPPPALGQIAEHVMAWWKERLQDTVDLYSAWAWGDVYGFIVEYAVYDEDGEIEDWEEVEGGSCWGFYGDDFAESGLEGEALAAVPDEPAPGVPVRQSDHNVLEDV